MYVDDGAPPPRDQVIPPRGSGVSRAYVGRSASARCLHCDWAESSSWALARATDHVRTTRHTVDGTYQSRLLYTPEVNA